MSGAIWLAQQAGFSNLLTFDYGWYGPTDVALGAEGQGPTAARNDGRRRDCARLVVVDVRSVGAGGGSHRSCAGLLSTVPRVGPESAGADPGPAAYGKGGELATVTDANVALGYLPDMTRLGWMMRLDRRLAERAVQRVGRPACLGCHFNAPPRA